MTIALGPAWFIGPQSIKEWPHCHIDMQEILTMTDPWEFMQGRGCNKPSSLPLCAICIGASHNYSSNCNCFLGGTTHHKGSRKRAVEEGPFLLELLQGWHNSVLLRIGLWISGKIKPLMCNLQKNFSTIIMASLWEGSTLRRFKLIWLYNRNPKEPKARNSLCVTVSLRPALLALSIAFWSLFSLGRVKPLHKSYSSWISTFMIRG